MNLFVGGVDRWTPPGRCGTYGVESNCGITQGRWSPSKVWLECAIIIFWGKYFKFYLEVSKNFFTLEKDEHTKWNFDVENL
jgi:hypothetical protein